MRNLILYLVLSVCFASFVGCVADGPESTMQEQAESAPTSGRDRALEMLTAAVGADAPRPEMGCQKGSVGADSWMCCFFDFCCWYGYPGTPSFCSAAITQEQEARDLERANSILVEMAPTDPDMRSSCGRRADGWTECCTTIQSCVLCSACYAGVCTTSQDGC